jgi:hypothetical protein
MRMNPFKKKKKKKSKVEIAKEKTLKRIESFRKHLSKKSKEDNSIQFFHLVRQFFADMFKIRYEFTFEELDEELKRKKISKELKEKITIFLKKISAVEYSDEKLSDNELKKLYDEFLRLFRKLTSDEGEIKDKTTKKLFGFLKIPAGNKQKENKKSLSFITALFSKFKIRLGKSRLEQIHDMLIKALDLINKDDFKESRRLYVKIKRKYDSLNVKEKEEVYDDIMLLYNEIAANKN